MDPTHLSPHWLRDNCPCTGCRDPRSGQKLFQIHELPDDLAITARSGPADAPEIRWSDGHLSRYPAGFLDAPAETDGRGEDAKRLWQAADFARGIPEAAWAAHRDDPDERAAVLTAVLRSGFALLRGVPAEEGQVLAVARSFGFVRETNYGELFDVRVEPDPNNLAFTTTAVAPHTDNPYRDPVPTLQLLHCLHDAATGGDSGLVDGFAAAAALRAEAPDDFAVLTRTPVPFVFRDRRTELRAERPLIETDGSGRIRGVRFNNRSTGTLRLPAAEADAFYAAYRRFARVILRPELRLGLRLTAGDCLIFDNTRVLHARTAFAQDGRRHLQGCYADLDSLVSALAVLRRRAAALDELEEAFEGEGAAEYLGEDVTLAQHMRQAGALAEAAGAPDHLVAAALLHDLGHFGGSGQELMEGRDNRHGSAGADRLARWFGPDVTGPVRLHVAAKRYLCAVEPEYAAGLSPASVYTLGVQGGPMDAVEAEAFAALPGAADAVAVRRWDDGAKDAATEAPPFAHFRPLLARLMAHAPA
ncbi:TauD/TfdA family dioxygenase [Kitasatospora sp. NBC_01539]|uniref:2-trimethylaminoethylphosphonate dioxygenase n=1 Tax=Kitasatospora sp. NBC_01539 TaxID=2903577 RepID=UPI0038601A26